MQASRPVPKPFPVSAILAKVTPTVDAKKIARAFHYLDASGDGQLDHKELDSALRRARRDQAPRDALAQIAGRWHVADVCTCPSCCLAPLTR